MSENHRVTFDEENIIKTRAEYKATMKIDEPKTPFVHDTLSEGESETEKLEYLEGSDWETTDSESASRKSSFEKKRSDHYKLPQ